MIRKKKMILNSIWRTLLIRLELFSISLLATNVATQTQLDQLIDSVSRDIPSIWTYKNNFPDINSLLLDERCLGNGIAVDGKNTRKSIARMVQSALSNKDVNVFVLGGSSTIGADLGSNNLKLTYHYALADWWNTAVGTLTRSRMKTTVVAVGGVGTTYFGHCWQEYVNVKEEFDYVTWEFAINDPDSIQYEKAVERFARDALSMKSSPGLTFVNFASKSKLATGRVNKCKRHEDEAKVVDRFAKHYFTTSIRWERALCSCKKFDSRKMLEKLFTKNHPKVIGHAQISYMLISYFKRVILETLHDRKTKPFFAGNIGQAFQTSGTAFQRFSEYQDSGIHLDIPEPIYMTKNDLNDASTCFTTVSPGPENPPHHSLESLKVMKNEGFTLLNESLWESAPEERYDSTGGYITQYPGKSLKIQFHVNGGSVPLSQISVTVRNKYFGGRVKFTLDEGTSNEAVVRADTSEKKKAGTNTIELGAAPKGMHTLDVYTETGGCNLCAIIID